jgi:DNA polymerase-3 subunit alpha
MRGLCSPGEIVEVAADMGMRAVAVTDFNMCSSFPKFVKACVKKGIKPILGTEVIVVPDMAVKERGFLGNVVLLAKNRIGYRNILKISSESHINGMYFKPRVDMALLELYSDGVICMTGSISGHVPTLLFKNEKDDALAAFKEYKRIYGDDFYCQMSVHNYFDSNMQEQERNVMADMYRMATHFGVKCVATNDVRYLRKEQQEPYDVLMCLDTGQYKCVKDDERYKIDSNDFYFKSAEEMLEMYPKHPEFIEETVNVADKIDDDVMEFGGDYVPGSHICGDKPPLDFLRDIVMDGMMKKGLSDKKEYMDRIEFELRVFEACGYVLYFLILWDFINFANNNGIRVGPGRGSAAGSLCLYVLDITKLDPIKYDLLFERFLSIETFRNIDESDFGIKPLGKDSIEVESRKIMDRVKRHPEFDIDIFNEEGREMKRLGVVDEFILMCAKFIDEDPVAGSENKCNSSIAYWLGITTKKPTGSLIIYEKMIATRVSPPDVDVDFDYDRRNEVYQYLREVYGEEYTCNIGTYNFFKVKATFKAVAKALDIGGCWEPGDKKAGQATLDKADLISKMTPGKAETIEEALEMNRDLAATLNKIPGFLDICRSIEGLPSHGGVHPAGLIVSNRKVVELAPMRVAAGQICSQFDGPQMEDNGLLKFDILAVTVLSVMGKTINMVEKRTGRKIDIDSIEPDDENVFMVFNKGLTKGVFQMEGGGITDLLKSMNVDSFEDIIATNAIYRPGPLEANVDKMYCDIKHGRMEATYEHESMRSVLEPTYGLIVYQEQVMNISKAMASFTSSEADKLRKAIGKKNMELMETMKEKFMRGCVANSIPERVARETWEKIEKFGGYGFNRSHAACYAMLAYQTAYLKRYHTVEFFSCLMTSEVGDADKIASYMSECRMLGIKVFPPHINLSKCEFELEDYVEAGEQKTAIRAPLTFLKGVGKKAVDIIVKNQPYNDLRDFVDKNNVREVTSKVVEVMAESRVFDCFGEDPDKVKKRFLAIKKELKSRKVDPANYSGGVSEFFKL